MAKRTRYPGKSSGRRPGANRLSKPGAPRAKPPVQPSVSGTVITPEADDDFEMPTAAFAVGRAAGLSQTEIERAAEIEADLTARERETVATAARLRARVNAAHDRVGDVNAPLSARASKEYANVARDVRRIIPTGGLMVAILAAFHVLVNVMGVIKL